MTIEVFLNSRNRTVDAAAALAAALKGEPPDEGELVSETSCGDRL